MNSAYTHKVKKKGGGTTHITQNRPTFYGLGENFSSSSFYEMGEVYIFSFEEENLFLKKPPAGIQLRFG
jgi:hypothetical protein